MDIDISCTNESINNLSFIKALLIKYSLEKLNISYVQKEELRKQILKQLKDE